MCYELMLERERTNIMVDFLLALFILFNVHLFNYSIVFYVKIRETILIFLYLKLILRLIKLKQ